MLRIHTSQPKQGVLHFLCSRLTRITEGPCVGAYYHFPDRTNWKGYLRIPNRTSPSFERVYQTKPPIQIDYDGKKEPIISADIEHTELPFPPIGWSRPWCTQLLQLSLAHGICRWRVESRTAQSVLCLGQILLAICRASWNNITFVWFHKSPWKNVHSSLLTWMSRARPQLQHVN